MNSINISIENENILVAHSSDTQENVFEFDIEQTVNLNEMVKYISNFDSEIDLIPVDLTALLASNNVNDKLVKLAEYIYKIMYAFNESYDSVYGVDEVGLERSELDNGAF